MSFFLIVPRNDDDILLFHETRFAGKFVSLNSKTSATTSLVLHNKEMRFNKVLRNISRQRSIKTLTHTFPDPPQAYVITESMLDGKNHTTV
jgi:hypothetical protein